MHRNTVDKSGLKQLTERIASITEMTGGTWGISLFDIDTKETWEVNEHLPFYAASVIKIPIMIAVFAASLREEIKLSSTMMLKREDIVGGSGVLQHMTPGTVFTIYDLVTLMIIQSDNTATNMLIDLVGTHNIQESMKDSGLETSRFYHKMMRKETNQKETNRITAHEMTNMLLKIAMGKIVSAEACREMITILKKQQIRNSLPVKIPESDEPVSGAPKQWELANKTGNVSGFRHDIGIFYVEKRWFIASILSKGVNDLDSPEVIGKIGLSIYNYLR